MLAASVLQRRARAVGYDHWQTVGSDAGGRLRDLVAFLEHRVIRLYKPEDREALCGADAATSAEWPAAFAAYLRELECPIAPGGTESSSEHDCVCWLLAHAVGLEYEDSAEQFNRGGGAARATSTDACGGDAAPAAAVLSEASRLAVALGVDPAPFLAAADAAGLRSLLQVLSSRVQLKLSESAVRAAVSSGATARSGAKDGASLGRVRPPPPGPATFPLGFSTGDTALDESATILKMLYISDLRQYQTGVNRVLELAQEHTADPQTDVKLGKVGF